MRLVSTMRYHCYNLDIDSDLELPEMLSLETAPCAPDVRIRLRKIGTNGLVDGIQTGPYLWISPQALWFYVPHVARFLIRNGNLILVDPEPNVDEESIRVFLLGSALAALLFQRGYLVLHGNAIRIGDQCMICAGPSGAGKSTLAAAFLERGYRMLADDVVPVDNHCRAVPGFPRVKLWKDVADNMGIDTTGLRRIRPQLEKFSLPLTTGFNSEPLPIRWIYILNSHEEPTFQSELIRGRQRFQRLYHNTYRVRFLESMNLRPDHLKRCGQLASRIHLTCITRPEHGFKLDTMVDHILAGVAAHS